MSKYIKEFNQTGISIINIDLVCKNWNDRFNIVTWVTDVEEIYTFVIYAKRNDRILCKTDISKEQALELAKKLNLIFVKDILFKNSGFFHTENFIKNEIERFTKMKHEKEGELNFIHNMLYNYERCV